jgi:hypothetical protein
VSLYDVSGALDDLLRPVRLIPGTRGEFVKGVWTPDVALERDILAHIQPSGDGKDIDAIPDALRDKETVVVYTKDEALLPEDKALHRSADVVVRDGVRYRIIAAKDWSHVGGYFRALAVKE